MLTNIFTKQMKFIFFTTIIILSNVLIADDAIMPLAKDGKAVVEILQPEAPTSQEKKSALELQKWLSQITGSEFRIISKPGNEPYISIGRTAEFEQQCQEEAKRNLGKEGYGIYFHNGNLFLYGGTQRGPLYAVMALLEEDLGCRWYTPDCTVIPHRPNLSFTPNSRHEQPQFGNREAFFKIAMNQEWALHNRSNPRWFKLPKEWGGSIMAPNTYYNVHTLFRLLPDSELSKHPEFFPMRYGKRVPLKYVSQPCLTAPGLGDYLIKKANAVLDRYPDANMISISQNDSNNWCQCPACKAELKREYTRSDQMMRLVNYVAAGIWEKHPDVMVEALAYQKTFMPPKNVKPDPRLCIQLCTGTHTNRWPHLKVNQTPNFFPALKAWHKVGNPIDIWDYTVDFWDYMRPFANMGVVADNLKIYRKYGVKNVMLQGSFSWVGGADAPIKSWVWTKLMWNPDLDWKKLQRDFVRGYFQVAAKPLQDYYDLLEETRQSWLKKPNRGDDLIFDHKFISQAEQYFTEAEKLAASNPKLLNRVLVAELPVIHLRLKNAAESLKIPNSADKEQYKKLLVKYEKIARQNHIIKIAELGRPKLETDLRDLRVMLLGKRAIVSPGTIAFCEEVLTTLWSKAEIVSDPLAGNGYAVKVPTNNKAWSVQWKHLPLNKFRFGRKYAVWVRMRFSIKPGSKGNAFACGVYNQDAGSHLKTFFPVQDIKPGYNWYRVGDFVPVSDDMVYVAPCNNPGVKEMYCDRIEIRKN